MDDGTGHHGRHCRRIPEAGVPVTLTITAVDGIGEVGEGTDLVALAGGHVTLQDGDVLVVTSKIVNKAEGRVVRKDRVEAVAEETVRTVARRGPTVIVENRLGLVMAAAGVDASNVEPGTVALLPEDPDRSARSLREGLHQTFGCNVAAIIADTAGRPWRRGQNRHRDRRLAGVHPLDPYGGSPTGTATSSRSPCPPSPTSSPASPRWPAANSGDAPSWSCGAWALESSRRRARAGSSGSRARAGGGHVRTRRARGLGDGSPQW